ncbi:C40 family peptidase [Paenibacillus sp. P96]|uniref:C40 family peptidase n=1 Tax=Paenibacillus zeirhizosphaerae TaxID=2987519 RepID=A0ABT9FU30_9BACL|nr:SH3 domain-containing C40 family peptidase [Paenibacillus sp. P96]MDP4098243.1 C40 family peptidase [Paenibacillus sp. P96]
MNWKSKIITLGVTATMLTASLTAGAFTASVSAAAVEYSKAKVIWGTNLRTSPSVSADVIRQLPKGETVTILEESGSEWYKVQDSANQTGYISSSTKYTEAIEGSGSDSGGSDYISTSDPDAVSTAKGSTSVEKVITAGMKYLGTPYEYGANRASTATFDCSSFVRRAFLDALGVKLPSDSRQQGDYVKSKGKVQTDWRKLKRGDLMYFMSYKGTKASAYGAVNKGSQRITHTGIYLGSGKILHTYSDAGGGVTISDIAGNHWEYRFLFGGSAL